MTDTVNSLQVSILSTVAGSGSNQRDAMVRREEIEEETYNAVEEEGTGGININNPHYGYGEEGAAAVGEMEDENRRTQDVGGQNEEEEEMEYDDNEEDEYDEDEGPDMGADDEGMETRGLYSQ